MSTIQIPPIEQFPRKPPTVSPPPLRWRQWKTDHKFYNQLLADIPAAWRDDRRSLHEKCVIVMGLGAVGGVCFEQLARLGVGRLYGFDPDRYSEASWITQPSLPQHQGRLKTEIQGRRAAKVNPGAQVATAPAFAQDVPLSVLRQAEVIVLAGDNLELLVWAGEYAAGLGKIVVQGAVHGPTQQAIVRAFDLSDPDRVCPTCLIADHEWSRTTSRIGCDPGRLHLQGLEPTRTMPHVCGAAGQIAAGEVICWLLGREDSTLVGAEVQFNLGCYRSLRTRFDRKKNCRGPHARWRIVDVEESPHEVTLACLARSLNHRASARQWLVKAEIPWITRGSCSSCGKLQPVRRFSRLGRKLARCGCGGVVWADVEGRRAIVPGDELSEIWEKPLANLGLKAGDSLAVCGEEAWTWFILS